MPTPNNSIHQMLQKLLGENYDWNGYLNQDTMPNAKYNDTKLDFGARGASGDTQFDLKARGASRPNSQPPKAGTQAPFSPRVPKPRIGGIKNPDIIGQGARLQAPKLPPLSPGQLTEPTHVRGIQREAQLLRNPKVTPPKGLTQSILPDKTGMMSGSPPATGLSKPGAGMGGMMKGGLGIAGMLSQLMDPGHMEEGDTPPTNAPEGIGQWGGADRIAKSLSGFLGGAQEAEGSTIVDDNIHSDPNAYAVNSPLDDAAKGITFPNSPIDVDKMTAPSGMEELMSRELGDSQIAPSAPGTEFLDEPVAAPSPKAKYNITAESLLNEGASFDPIESQITKALSGVDEASTSQQQPAHELVDVPTPNWDTIMGPGTKLPPKGGGKMNYQMNPMGRR